MKIAEYFNTIEGKRIKKGALCDEVGISYATLSHLLVDEYLPSLKTAIAIEKFTNGKVSVYDWLPTQSNDTQEIHHRDGNSQKKDKQITK
jgi:DNA-binding XRE family transcriptional regulator